MTTPYIPSPEKMEKELDAMTKEQVIARARAAGAETSDGIHWEFDDFDPLKFATLVGNAKLEEAAKVCEVWNDEPLSHTSVAAIIRNLKEPTT